MVMSYDYTVLAGTQGLQNHRKKDRLFELAERHAPSRRGVHRRAAADVPGDTDGTGLAGLDCMAFNLFGGLSGLVPLVAINSGRCFAGNASLLGCCDVVIATDNSNIGMGGPAMIEGGGLGVFRPDEVGPMSVQVPNGVVDVAVPTRPRRSRVAKQYLSYFQGPITEWDVRRPAVAPRRDPGEPAPRLRRPRSHRHAGRHGLGARAASRASASAWSRRSSASRGDRSGSSRTTRCISRARSTSDGADKAARFMQLCDAFDLPILFLCDTPGIMVGPEVEKTALGASLQPHVRDRGEHDRAVLHDRAAQGVRARRAGDGGRRASTRRSSPSHGRPVSSAAWDSKAR